jgi:hypothetical protein
MSVVAISEMDTIYADRSFKATAAADADRSLGITENLPRKCRRLFEPTEQEWLALFPVAPEGPPLSDSHLSGFGDASERSRCIAAQSNTYYRKGSLVRPRALPGPQISRFRCTFAELFAGNLGQRVGAAYAISSCSYFALNAPMYLYNDGRFQLTDMVASTVSMVLVILGGGFPAFFTGVKPAFNDGKDVEHTVVEGYLRWEQALPNLGTEDVQIGESGKGEQTRDEKELEEAYL